jgi:osmotically-inducible protein OsmY
MPMERNDKALTLLTGIGIGAAIMYFLDPDRGARRRALLADQAVSRVRTGAREAAELADDARNHARGAAAELRGRMRDEEVSNDQLVARVRAELGRHVERVRGIEVVADGGTVTLRGKVDADAMAEAMAAARQVRGVERVLSELSLSPREGESVRLD